MSAAAVSLFTAPLRAEGLCDLLNRANTAHRSDVTVSGRLFFASNTTMIGDTGCTDRRGVAIEPSVLRVDADSDKSRKQLAQLREKTDAIRARGAYPLVTASVKGYFVVELERSAMFRAAIELKKLGDVRIDELPGAKSLTPVPVCEVLKDPARFRDQRIALDAVTVDDALNGVWLAGSCGAPAGHPSMLHRAYPGYVLPGLVSAFDAKPAAEALAARPRHRTTVVGWVRVAGGYAARCSGDVLTRGNGFGPLGAAAVRFEVEETLSASPITAAEAMPFEAEPQRCPAQLN